MARTILNTGVGYELDDPEALGRKRLISPIVETGQNTVLDKAEPVAAPYASDPIADRNANNAAQGALGEKAANDYDIRRLKENLRHEMGVSQGQITFNRAAGRPILTEMKNLQAMQGMYAELTPGGTAAERISAKQTEAQSTLGNKKIDTEAASEASKTAMLDKYHTGSLGIQGINAATEQQKTGILAGQAQKESELIPAKKELLTAQAGKESAEADYYRGGKGAETARATLLEKGLQDIESDAASQKARILEKHGLADRGQWTAFGLRDPRNASAQELDIIAAEANARKDAILSRAGGGRTRPDVTPPLSQVKKMAKEKNYGMTDAQIEQWYNATYGGR